MRNLNDYIKNSTHKKIAEVYDKASTPEELEAAKKFQQQLLDPMTPEERHIYEREFVEDHRRMLAAMDEDIAELQAEVLRKQLDDTAYKLIPWKYVAEKYFGKSQSWLAQRVNGYSVRGHRYTLNEEQKQILNRALSEIGTLIGSYRVA